MSALPIHYQKRSVRCVSVITPFLRRLNMGTLAFVLFVALALMNTMRGKEPETKASAPAKATKTEVIIGNFSFSPKTLTVPVGATVTWTNHDKVPHLVTTARSEEHTSELQSHSDLVCRLLLEKKKIQT